MDLTLPQDLSDMDAAVATLCAQASKDALAAYARGKCNWKGDDARTSKSDIARAILECHKAKEFDYPTPEREAQAIARAVQHEQQPEQEAPAVKPEPKKEPKPEQRAPRELFKPADLGNVQGQIAQAIGAALAGIKFGVDEESVRSIVRAELSQIEPARIIVREGRDDVRMDEHTHPVFEKCVKLVSAGQAILLKGPAGCGKSHLAAQIAKATGKEYGALHCSAGASESQLLGWLLPHRRRRPV